MLCLHRKKKLKNENTWTIQVLLPSQSIHLLYGDFWHILFIFFQCSLIKYCSLVFPLLFPIYSPHVSFDVSRPNHNRGTYTITFLILSQQIFSQAFLLFNHFRIILNNIIEYKSGFFHLWNFASFTRNITLRAIERWKKKIF